MLSIALIAFCVKIYGHFIWYLNRIYSREGVFMREKTEGSWEMQFAGLQQNLLGLLCITLFANWSGMPCAYAPGVKCKGRRVPTL